jgi:hypothetical protein
MAPLWFPGQRVQVATDHSAVGEKPNRLIRIVSDHHRDPHLQRFTAGTFEALPAFLVGGLAKSRER